MKAYKKSVEDIFNYFDLKESQGLSSQKAFKIQKEIGKNVLPPAPQPSLLVKFLHQFQNPLIYILVLAATIIFFVGAPIDALVISGILFFNAIIGTIQEGRTEKILESLRKYFRFNVIAIRDGQKRIIDVNELVPGDIVIVQEGEKVPADMRLFETQNLLVDESMLTGESIAVEKTIEKIEKDVSIADQKNMLFKGTYVLSGFAKAIIIETGARTELGKIGHAIEEIETEMPLKREIDHLSHYILYFILAMCAFLFLIGLWQGRTFTEMLVILTALFICVIPEGLPVIMTLTLVTGAYRMSKEHILIKRLQAAEGLGRADVIVIDKTGTLTRNEMVVSKIYTDNKVFQVTGQGYAEQGNLVIDGKIITTIDPTIKAISLGASLLNKTEVEHSSTTGLYIIKGDPTEAALNVFSKKIDKDIPFLVKDYIPLYEQPFESSLRYKGGIYKSNDELICFIAGAPEVIINKCNNISFQTEKTLTSFFDEGLRTIAIAEKKIALNVLSNDWFYDKDKLKNFLNENNFSFLGLLGIEDSIRAEVKDIITEAKKNGLSIIMATGDHKTTALFVARKVGIFHEGDGVINGSELDSLSDEELLERLPKVKVFSRVSPEHKLRIIRLLRKQGKMVAMTGDGVNDAPSLVAADLGIAMGSIGTEVAKQASDIILLDDSFASIVHAIEQGRHIFETLRRVVTYFFATNMAEVFIIFFALLLNMPLPLVAVQILWLNLITDGFLDVALSLEPCHEKLLHKEAHTKKLNRLVDWKVFFIMLYLSIPMAFGSLFIFSLYYQTNIELARTMALVTMAVYQWFNAWNCRSERFSIFEIGILSNHWLILATFFVLVLQVIILYTSLGQLIFKTVPLTVSQWGLIFIITAPLFFIEELRKIFIKYLSTENLTQKNNSVD